MHVQSKFPINKPFYEIREIRDFKDLVDQSEKLFSERPAYKLIATCVIQSTILQTVS